MVPLIFEPKQGPFFLLGTVEPVVTSKALCLIETQRRLLLLAKNRSERERLENQLQSLLGSGGYIYSIKEMRSFQCGAYWNFPLVE